MAKLNCICGAQLSNCSCPNEVEGYILRDIDLDRMYEDVDACKIMDLARGVWECHECGRIAVDHPDGRPCHVKWYRPEDGEPGGIMKFDQS